MPERLFVYLIYGLQLGCRLKNAKNLLPNTFFLPIFLLFLLSGFLCCVSHIFTKDFQFGLFNRYLIYLVPADVMMFVLASSGPVAMEQKELLGLHEHVDLLGRVGDHPGINNLQGNFGISPLFAFTGVKYEILGRSCTPVGKIPKILSGRRCLGQTG